MTALLFRWANDQGAHGMPTPAELEADGYIVSHRHPLFPRSVLMWKRESMDDAPEPAP